jgi:hypothetical protein
MKSKNPSVDQAALDDEYEKDDPGCTKGGNGSGGAPQTPERQLY